jgi:hypothetical protein
VEHTEVGVAYGEVAVAPYLPGEHETVRGAIHRLHRPLLPLDVEAEHSVFVMHGVSALVPQVEVENVGGDDLIVPALPVMLLNEVNEFVVYAGAVGKPECGAGG